MRYKLILFLISLHLKCFAQPYKIEIFIDYYDVIKDLKMNPNDEKLKDKYDLSTILLLDSSEAKLIKRIQPDIINDFKNSSTSLKLSNKTIGFKTEKNNIKDLLIDKVDQKRIFECSHTENSPDIKYLQIDFPVYIKDNTAIFSISGPTWYDLYFARLENHIIQINWLGGIIE